MTNSESSSELPASAAFNRPKLPLSQSRVAIVTTAALRLDSQPKFQGGDQSFRILPPTTDGLILGQISPNFDRSGFIADPNVVFPIDRLQEMVRDGEIGSLAPRHIAFLGAQGETLTTIVMDTGPAAAKILKDDGVDVVLLTPV
jgi:D-proline reductase (dithiol) PrdB